MSGDFNQKQLTAEICGTITQMASLSGIFMNAACGTEDQRDKLDYTQAALNIETARIYVNNRLDEYQWSDTKFDTESHITGVTAKHSFSEANNLLRESIKISETNTPMSVKKQELINKLDRALTMAAQASYILTDGKEPMPTFNFTTLGH